MTYPSPFPAVHGSWQVIRGIKYSMIRGRLGRVYNTANLRTLLVYSFKAPPATQFTWEQVNSFTRSRYTTTCPVDEALLVVPILCDQYKWDNIKPPLSLSFPQASDPWYLNHVVIFIVILTTSRWISPTVIWPFVSESVTSELTSVLGACRPL